MCSCGYKTLKIKASFLFYFPIPIFLFSEGLLAPPGVPYLENSYQLHDGQALPTYLQQRSIDCSRLCTDIVIAAFLASCDSDNGWWWRNQRASESQYNSLHFSRSSYNVCTHTLVFHTHTLRCGSHTGPSSVTSLNVITVRVAPISCTARQLHSQLE